MISVLTKPVSVSAPSTVALPRRSAWLEQFFRWYVPRYLARHFHRVAVARGTLPKVPGNVPLVVYANHPGWWDPLLGMLLAWRCFPQHEFFAPIDAGALARYRIFERLGFYGVGPDARVGARRFLEVGRVLLNRSNTSVWMTPEGRFTDPREDAPFEPGLGHLLATLDRAWVLPAAIEYPFWYERSPEALVRFGAAIDVGQYPQLSKGAWTELLRERLRSAQHKLAEQSMRREMRDFHVLVAGRAGVGGVYDLGRRVGAWITRQPFVAEHGR
jgi:1-acyl-sn-glycerol-3-phosphate acyltransferase